jgi:urea carboxylase
MIGPAPAKDSYLNIDAILDAAKRSGAEAIHPGYGFLAENAEFARRVEANGLIFIGPSPEHIACLGPKDTARRLAQQAGVTLAPGTGLLRSADDAVRQARIIGLPVMLKAANGGGGIGMQACFCDDEVRDAFDQVQRLARLNSGDDGVFLERLVRPARHVEVQIFGDGNGRVAVIGDRDCSLQRRNQKVVEEAPAPDLPEHVRARMHHDAKALAQSINYRSVGTVEFIYDPAQEDPAQEEAYFLEVNTRLQVEHPVTEEAYGVDLVQSAIRFARAGTESPEGLDPAFFETDFRPVRHAVEARIYAEDPAKECAPCPGLVTQVVLPGQGNAPMPGVRVESWIRTGLEVGPYYDPMLAKIVARGATRDEAFALLGQALGSSRVDGVVTNLGMLTALCANPDVLACRHSTTTLATTADPNPRIDVLAPGLLTTIQDYPGRLGHWQVGVPPSGPMDALSFTEANLAVGNPAGAPALECTANGPTLRFSASATICITGAHATCTLDGLPIEQWRTVDVTPGQMLQIGEAIGTGIRMYLAVRGGFDVPKYLGSASTFTLGGFGGHCGRALRAGDVLRTGSPDAQADHPAFPTDRTLGCTGPTDRTLGRIRWGVPWERRPYMTHDWQIAVTEGPHEAPEFFTQADIDEFYSSTYHVHYNSARTGVRLIGPHPHWARKDGGEAGLHPSNIHDTPYSVGALNFTGDTPIILGPDGPSLGGFVCPAVVASGDMWKVGQLRPGDTVRFARISEAQAPHVIRRCSSALPIEDDGDHDHGVMARLPATSERPSVTYRRAGDCNLLVEYGEPVLDIGYRMRVHALMQAIDHSGTPGIIDITPGMRSLHIHMDGRLSTPRGILARLQSIEQTIPDTAHLSVPSRIIRLPLEWNDANTRLAIERYTNGIRPDAPWCPSNIEFIRRINGLDGVDDVYRTVFDATYLVVGLGDVYLGAPLATPLDPRHRLVTTKYNPARTWTAEGTVGLGGAYLCVYGMDGPGGYQLVGRTVPMWNSHRRGSLYAEHPWALRFFDRITWYPVDHDELMELRSQAQAGRGIFSIEEGEFSYSDYRRFLDEHADSISACAERQQRSFSAERERWDESGEFDRGSETTLPSQPRSISVPPDAEPVTAPMTATLWQIVVGIGDTVRRGDKLASLEAMKMETAIISPASGTVSGIFARSGEEVAQGQILLCITSVQDDTLDR